MLYNAALGGGGGGAVCTSKELKSSLQNVFTEILLLVAVLINLSEVKWSSKVDRIRLAYLILKV